MIDRKKVGIIGGLSFAAIAMIFYLISTVFGIKLLLVPTAQYENYKSLEKITELKTYIHESYVDKVDDKALTEGAIKGMFDSLKDPYSVYFTAKEYKSFNEDMNGKFGGIGVIVTKGDDGLVTVVAPIEDTPGSRAGLRTNDKIVKIGGIDITAISLDEAVGKMKGDPGTKVHISVLREKEKELIELDLTRELIKIKTVKEKMLDGNIGYVKMSMFDVDTHKDFQVALEKLKSQNMKGMILDLRQNPGGYMEQAINIADLLMDKGLVVYTMDRKGKREDFNSKDGKLNVPFVVLVDKGSASASEILAGAIKDRNIAKLIGVKTFGKGVVQTVESLKDGSGFKITSQKYFTPKGISINKIGIEPDIEVKALEPKKGEDSDKLKDVQMDKALEYLKSIMK